MILSAVIMIDNFSEYSFVYQENEYYYLILPNDDFIAAKLVTQNAIIEIDFKQYEFSKEQIRGRNTIDKYNKYLKIEGSNLVLFKIKLGKEVK